MNKTTITFYGGLRTIGGTIVSLQYGDARVIFDFGLVYSPATDIFDGHIKQRKTAAARDYLKLGMLPKIDGIYSENTLMDETSLAAASQSEGTTAVLISHLHLDHMAATGLIDPSIPVYMTSDSLKLYHVLETIGEGVPGSNRTYQPCDYHQTFNVGEIKITPIQVDHDIPGACAYHLETPDGALLYTGDLRMHGAYPERIEAFINKAKELGFDAVITEGTTLTAEAELPEHLLAADPRLPDDLLTENMVPLQMAEILKDTQGVGLFNIYHRNIDRVNGILQAGKAAGRKVVFEAATAQIASSLLNSSEFFVYQSEEMRQAVKAHHLPSWQAALLNEVPSVSFKEINENPAMYFVQNSYEHSLELFDLHVTNGIYLHSNGMPLGSYDPSYQNLDRILNILRLEKISVGAGGHAIPQHLKFIIDELNPAILILLHSFYPERLKPKDGVQLLPEYGKTYILSNGEIIEAYGTLSASFR